jgi:MerR family transcriptional regulator, light-induced transcriptional regulator
MISNSIYNTYFESLLSGDHVKCQRIVLQLMNQETHFRELYIGLFQRSMYHAGELWKENKISVANEHIITNITENMISLLQPSLHARRATNKTILIACCENEYHSVGARIISDFFELNGWKVLFLGANMPLKDLLLSLCQYRPDVCGFSVTMAENLQTLESAIASTQSLFSQMEIIVGGQAFEIESGVNRDFIKKVVYLQNLEEVEMYIIQNIV